MIPLGDFDKHLELMKQKLRSTYRAYRHGEHTVVGDLAIKVIEQALEGDAAREGRHLGDHKPRFDYAKGIFTKRLFQKMRKVWFIYGDLGYDGVNGKKAKRAIKLLDDLIKFFEDRWGMQIERD